nr:imelysin family protein [uncultured Dongia sp.]
MSDKRNDKITRRQTLAAILAASMVPAMTRHARAAEPDFGAFNTAFAAKVILPALDNLVKVTDSFAATAAAFDAANGAGDFDKVRQGFNNVADAWASAQQFRLGALAQEQRSERFAYWPERRNVVDKQYRALLAGKGKEGLEAAQFATGSVAVQGLPALERLLYESVSADGDQAKRRSAVILAIANNLKSIAAEAKAVWEKTLQDPALAANTFAANPAEGTAQSYTNLLTITQVIADQKIGAPLGGDAAAAKPKAAEQWRSGRSMRNIVLNLTTARGSVLNPGGFADLLGADKAALKADLTKAFDDSIAAAKAVGDNFAEDIAHQEMRKPVTALLVKINHLRDLLRQQVPPAIGITLGFNELDGDGS